MSLLVYLLKVIVVSAIFYGYYRLFLRNKRFHHYNRFFLLSALLLSIVLPFIRIPLLYQPENPVNHAVYSTVSVINSDYGEDALPVQETGPINESVFTLLNSIYLLYTIGVLFLMTLLVKSLLYIRTLRKRYTAENITDLRFYNTHEPGTPFSFFRSIFWNEQLSFNSHEGQQIFRHELFHVQHRHSADRLLSELVSAIFWFNPFFHLVKKELKAIHEFLADQFAISESDRYAYATLLVQQALDVQKHALTNHFFQNHIKRRIAMITQFNQTNVGYWSRVMILPVSLLLFCFVTLYAKKPLPRAAVKTEAAVFEQPLTLLVDAGHGGSDAGARLQNVKEKDLTLQISRKIQELAAGMNINVIMTREGDYLAGNKITSAEAVRYTTSLIADRKPDAVVSIHIGIASEASAGKNGIDLYITDKNSGTRQSSRVLGEMLIGSLNPVYTVNPVLRQLKAKSIYVLDQAVQPAVLIECGYLNNSKDLEFISNPANQEKIAMGILQGLINFKKAALVSEAPNDTTPDKEKRERELRELRKKMEERQVELKEQREMELEILKKKMQEQEILSMEQSRNRERTEMEILKTEMKQRRDRMSEERKAQLQVMRKIMKEQEEKIGSEQGDKEEAEAKLRDIRKKMQEIENNAEAKHEEENRMIEEKMKEIERTSEQQMKLHEKRREEIMSLKEKMMEREHELKRENKEDFDKVKEELRNQQKEIKNKQKEIKEREKELKKERDREREKEKGSGFNEVKKQRDSLLLSVIRHYHRQLRYPDAAIQRRAEGPVYFSVVIDKEGNFKDFTTYAKPPAETMEKIVVVTNNQSVLALEKEASAEEKQELLQEAVKRASVRSSSRPINPSIERKYFLTVVFHIEGQQEDKKQIVTQSSFDFTQESKFERFDHFEFQDTIPAKPARSAVLLKATPSPSAAPSKLVRFSKERVGNEPRKPRLFNKPRVEKNEPVIFKERLLKSPSKPLFKRVDPTKPKPVDDSKQKIDN